MTDFSLMPWKCGNCGNNATVIYVWVKSTPQGKVYYSRLPRRENGVGTPRSFGAACELQPLCPECEKTAMYPGEGAAPYVLRAPLVREKLTRSQIERLQKNEAVVVPIETERRMRNF